MRISWLIALLVVLRFLLPDNAHAASPFLVTAVLETRDSVPVVRVVFEMPAKHLLYADHLKVEASGGATLAPMIVPEPVTIFDKLSGENKSVHGKSFEAVYKLEGARDEVDVTVSFQGCNETLCFFPESKTFSLSLGQPEGQETGAVEQKSVQSSEDWKTLVGQFNVAASESGYLKKDDFLAFLDKAISGGSGDGDALSRFNRLGALATVLLIVLGGLGLNLTPCVLPLIPINLAIIGAGAKAGSKGRGFALGGIYGLGMAITYGALGLVVVLTGSKFGALNASPWFNAVIAAIFFVLALAMFDVITIDLARFQGSSVPGASKKGHFAAVFVMGAVSALLAGACVAPMVIFVLLLAGSLFSKGLVLGLFLPFLLGLGMALPWPFAGAGLSFLPKPGKWMTWVKYTFGIIILVVAMYYGYEAYRIFQATRPPRGAGSSVVPQESDVALVEGLQRAQKEGKPVFIDFWATWCKNCVAMDKTTFKDSDVQKKLEGFVTVKYQAESPNDPPAKDVLDAFKAIGLPTYVVLVPKSGP
jgi:thiol:disulfide interchange protein DsbD